MHILVVRFSAFGDVAMTVPVIWSVAKQYPHHRFTVLSRVSMEPLFARMPENVSFYGVDLKRDYRGVGGLLRLCRNVWKSGAFDAVCDLHDVLRSRVLRWWFRLQGVRTASIDKGKAGKRRLTRKRNKVMQMQPSSFAHYCDVFTALGLPVSLDFSSIFPKGEKGDFNRICDRVGRRQEGEIWIGIAPFAAHVGKVYPADKMEEVIARLGEKEGIRLFLFGCGKHEEEVMEQWAGKYPAVSLTAGLRMERELILMSHLDVMLSMDSANMHLASLVGLPVVSVWGATHPYCGFMGYRQRMENAVQVDGLACRPCSIFGNRLCRRGDYACLNGITPETVVEHLLSVAENRRDS